MYPTTTFNPCDAINVQMNMTGINIRLFIAYICVNR